MWKGANRPPQSEDEVKQRNSSRKYESLGSVSGVPAGAASRAWANIYRGDDQQEAHAALAASAARTKRGAPSPATRPLPLTQ
ncbi:hypothetical protein E2C01_046877 [Portunus trituberculatus]|uniref:Uncharacterized protein n=1 Tax=Portunus trituberculatus TaxID=210409 RepID=A0A5B7G6W2_PORTR|nr:hypothetical protein [Portunus trituberculatus]